MAVQMHVAHSSIMRGAGVIAGVAYGCTGPEFHLAFAWIECLIVWMEFHSSGVPPVQMFP